MLRLEVAGAARASTHHWAPPPRRRRHRGRASGSPPRIGASPRRSRGSKATARSPTHDNLHRSLPSDTNAGSRRTSPASAATLSIGIPRPCCTPGDRRSGAAHRRRKRGPAVGRGARGRYPPVPRSRPTSSAHPPGRGRTSDHQSLSPHSTPAISQSTKQIAGRVARSVGEDVLGGQVVVHQGRGLPGDHLHTRPWMRGPSSSAANPGETPTTVRARPPSGEVWPCEAK